MLYEISMLVLAIAGVVGIAVCSYKMSRGRVYPVGIVRRSPAQQPPGSAVDAQDVVYLEAKNVQMAPLDCWRGEAGPLAIAQADGVIFLEPKSSEVVLSVQDWVGNVVSDPPFAGLAHVNVRVGSHWRCPKCGSLQSGETQAGKEDRCERCAYVRDLQSAGSIVITPQGQMLRRTPGLQSQIAEHDRTLQALEERIRKLEKDSVDQKIQEVTRGTDDAGRRRDWVQ